MADSSKIEWTEGTWNPLVGCTIHSAGCTHCYAMKTAWRMQHNPNARIAAKFEGTAKQVNGRAVWTGRINLDDGALLAPLKRRTPTTWFVNSLSDLFHEDVPDEWIDRIFAVILLSSGRSGPSVRFKMRHLYQILSKRSDRMRAYMKDPATPARIAMEAREIEGPTSPTIEEVTRKWPFKNVWLGVSVEDQRAADARIADLLATPAAVRFLSCEPLLGPVDLTQIPIFGSSENALPRKDLLQLCVREAAAVLEGGAEINPTLSALQTQPLLDGYSFGQSKLDWVICGGEGREGPRPVHPDWARSLRDQCAAAGVPFFFKQWGSCLPGAMSGESETGGPAYEIDEEHCGVDYDVLGRGVEVSAHGASFIRFGHKRTGRLLDGVQHDGMPV